MRAVSRERQPRGVVRIFHLPLLRDRVKLILAQQREVGPAEGGRAASMLPLLLHIRSRTIPSHEPKRPPACSRRYAVRSQSQGSKLTKWAVRGSHSRHSACKAHALPAELTARGD